MPEDANLSPRQAAFVREYLIDLNATKAAIRAGYSAKTAYAAGSRALKSVKVSAMISKTMAARAEKLEIKAEKVLAELAKLGFSNMHDYIKITDGGLPYTDFSAMTRDQAAAINEVTCETYVERQGDDEDDALVVKRVKFKLSDKRAALVDIGKHLGMFKDHHVVEPSDALTLLLTEIAHGGTRAGS